MSSEHRRGTGPRRKTGPSSSNWFLRLWEAAQAKIIDNIAATIVVTATLAFSTGIAATWAWYKTVVALTNVVSCVADVEEWADKEEFSPEVFLAGWGGSLILTELLIQRLYGSRPSHPPVYVLYELPPDSNDPKYNKFGTKFVSSSTKRQFFIPHAIEAEDRNKKILIFDDWANTGNTLNETKEELKKLNFAQVKTVVLAASKINLTKRPDHICFETNEPWEKLPWRPRPGGF